MDDAQIPLARLQEMLVDIDVPDADIRSYLMASAEDSAPLHPSVKINPTRVGADAVEGALVLASLNGVARWRRQQRYRRKIAHWQGLRIVSEGDSWFQYPFLLDDVIDQLSDAYAILSLDAAGDLLSDMVRQNELVTAVVQERPDLVLLSGGGNDLLGGARLSRMLPPYAAGRPAEAYLGAAFEATLAQVTAAYETLLARLAAVAPGMPVVCHGYDHAIPAQGHWLGRPLAGIGIADAVLQRAIVRHIVDRFHDELERMAERHPQVRLVDCRGSVQDGRWHDELHPTSAGFHAVAALFGDAIADLTGTAAPFTEAAGGLEVDAVPVPASPAEAGLALRAAYSEPVLLREIGRRKLLQDAGDGAAGDPVAVYRSSIEGLFPQQLALGVRIADGAAHSLAGSMCEGMPAEGLVRAHRIGPAALVATTMAALAGYAGLPAPALALLAAVLVTRDPTAPPAALCNTWRAAPAHCDA